MELDCWRVWFSHATWELPCIFWTTSYPQPTLSASTCSTTLSKKETSFLHSLWRLQRKIFMRAAIVSPTVVPLFFARFVSCIQLFLQYDSVCPQGVTQQVTHRVAPLLTGTTYGDNVRLLNSVIQVCHNEPKVHVRFSVITDNCLHPGDCRCVAFNTFVVGVGSMDQNSHLCFGWWYTIAIERLNVQSKPH